MGRLKYLRTTLRSSTTTVELEQSLCRSRLESLLCITVAEMLGLIRYAYLHHRYPGKQHRRKPGKENLVNGKPSGNAESQGNFSRLSANQVKRPNRTSPSLRSADL